MPGYKIELKNITKSFAQTPVLKDINLTVEPGEFVALVGKSGCGKSTLLRIISALEKPSGGEVVINNKKISAINPEVRFLFQEARLLPWKNVFQNVMLGAKDRDKQKTLNALKAVGLDKKELAWPSALSGGQKQRVALARALAGTPKVMLLDEPLGALDALTRINMQKLIENLWARQGFTAVFVTHDVSEAVYLADRVVLIEDGLITLNQKITLSRPRVSTDSNFTYFEKLILERIITDNAENSIEYII